MVAKPGDSMKMHIKNDATIIFMAVLWYNPDCLSEEDLIDWYIKEFYEVKLKNLSPYELLDTLKQNERLILNRLYRTFKEEPNEIPYRIKELSQSTSSVNQMLANLIITVIEHFRRIPCSDHYNTFSIPTFCGTKPHFS